MFVSRLHGVMLNTHSLPGTGIVIWMTSFYITTHPVCCLCKRHLERVYAYVCLLSKAQQVFPTGMICCSLCFCLSRLTELAGHCTREPTRYIGWCCQSMLACCILPSHFSPSPSLPFLSFSHSLSLPPSLSSSPFPRLPSFLLPSL